MRRQSVFEIWMRTGRQADMVEAKFNPWHDPDDGRFTFVGQGRYFGRGGSAERSPSLTSRPARRPPTTSVGPSKQGVRAPTERTKGEMVAREVRERREFREHLEKREGREDVVYRDTNGYLTVGIGHKVTKADRLSIGDKITDAPIEAFFRADSDKALRAARKQMSEAGISNSSFLVSLASVNFQLGEGWKNKFVETWNLIKARKYAAAAVEVEDSKWFRKDSPVRVKDFQEALRELEKAEEARRSAARRRMGNTR